MKFCRIVLICLSLSFGIGACLRPTAPPSPLPTRTPLPPTETPTPTIIWFPPTPTFTPLPPPTLSITPTVDVRPQYGALVFSDDFSDSNLWELGIFPAGSIALGEKELTLVVTADRGYLFSLRQTPSLKDFYVEVTASPSICRGLDEYGMLLRVSASLEFYRFSLTCDGQGRVDRYTAGRASSPVPLTMSGAIPRGAPSQSRLSAWVVGKEIRFYVNNTYQFSLRDPLLPSGRIGLFARASGVDPVTINFSNLQVYEASP